MLAAQIAVGAAIEREAVAKSELDATSLDLLLRLELAPGRRLRAVELCRQLLLSPSHVSRMLDRAESAGLVLRVPDPDDRRASQVVLTDKGRRAVCAFAPHLESVIDQIINQALSADEVETLVRLLRRVERAARGCGAES